MYELFFRHFDNARREVFERDLAEKDSVLWLSEAGRLCGFSTLQIFPFAVDGEVVTVVYSGDTIVAPAAWGSSTLPRAWIGAVLDARERDRRLYWLLLSAGYRTYRFLPLFFREYHPTVAAAPVPLSVLAARLAHARFGPRYDAARGIVRFEEASRLRAGLGEVTAERLRDRHVSFFAERNPGHAQGDELVCLTEIAEGNLTAAGQRMVARRLVPGQA